MFLKLDLTCQTKATKEMVVQELSFSVVDQALTNVHIDVVTLSSHDASHSGIY